jgi:Kef-type K+ transport system membrane component KefB
VKKDKDPVSHTLKVVMSPIVMIFFVIVGASIDLGVIANIAIVLLAGLYVVGRTFAKYFGARIGAQLTNTPPLTSKNLGLCLMSQAGVAVGLSLIIERNLVVLGGEAATYGILILNVIILTTMILQVFGPIAASEGLRRAGEFPKEPDTPAIHSVGLSGCENVANHNDDSDPFFDPPQPPEDERPL